MTDPGMDSMVGPEIDWSMLEPESVPDDLTDPPPVSGLDDDTVTPIPADFVKPKRRKPGAKAYEDKVRGSLRTVAQLAAPHPATIADAAAIIMYGPNLATAMGDLAVENANVARAIDFMTGGTENPAAAAVLAAAPLLIQIVRNHEPQLEPVPRGIPIPFVKDRDGKKRRIRVKFGVKLGNLRNLSWAPDHLTGYVFSHPKVRAAAESWGVQFVQPTNNGRYPG